MDQALQHLGSMEYDETTFPGTVRSVVWGVKESFRTYFERLPDHVYSLAGGTSRNADGTFSFPGKSDGELLLGGGRLLSFAGTLALTAHHGALSVTLAEPEILLGGEGRGTLSAIVDEVNEEPIRMAIAELQFTGMTGCLETPQANYSAVLATDGQYLFMGNYFAGDPLDQVAIQLEGSTES